MAPEWDPAKAKANLRKHGVRFADAVTALEDERALSIREESSNEERWIAIGMDSRARLVVVVYTWRGAAEADFGALGNSARASPIRERL
jgi:uncharacterized protein